MKRLAFLVILWNLTTIGFGQEIVFEEPEDEKYPSKQETDYYAKNKYKEFKPAELDFINKLKYDYIVNKEFDTKNRFKDVWGQTKFQTYYDSLQNICVTNRNKIRDFQDEKADAKYSACMDSVRNLTYSKKTAGIFDYLILRYDSLNNIKILFYRDPELEERNFGYWIAISKDKGSTWKNYYTGLVENYFYYIKPNPKIRLIKNESTIQLEVAVVRKTRQEMLPVGAPEFELVKDNLVIELDLPKLTSDKDNDGLTDILENKFFTNPHKQDTDGDGIDDFMDRNPRHKDVKSKHSVLYKFLLEYSTMDSAFVSFNYEFREKKGSVGDRARTYLIVTDDPNINNIEGTKNRYIILTKKEFEEYKKYNYVPLKELGVSPSFDIDGKPGQKKIHINGGFWGHDYLLIEKPEGWIVKSIGSYII